MQNAVWGISGTPLALSDTTRAHCNELLLLGVIPAVDIFDQWNFILCYYIAFVIYSFITIPFQDDN